MNKYIFHLILCFLVSCKLINPQEPTPHFLHVDSLSLASVDPNIHGSVSHKIVDVWAYHNNNLLGAYKLPADIPIQNEAPGTIDLWAGILTNGVQATREAYIFYDIWSGKVDWPAGERKTINPTISYRPNCVFHLIEDFELGSSLIPNIGDTTFIKYSGPETYEGLSSGYAYVDKQKPLARSVFQSAYFLPANKAYFIEMNYKCNVPIAILVNTTINGNFKEVVLGGVNPKASWNKIYFNLGELINSLRSSQPYNIVLKAELPKDSTSGYAYIDNFKIVGL